MQFLAASADIFARGFDTESRRFPHRRAGLVAAHLVDQHNTGADEPSCLIKIISQATTDQQGIEALLFASSQGIYSLFSRSLAWEASELPG